MYKILEQKILFLGGGFEIIYHHQQKSSSQIHKSTILWYKISLLWVKVCVVVVRTRFAGVFDSLHNNILHLENFVLECEDQNTSGDEDSSGAGYDVRENIGDEALDSEGQDQLQTPETGHEIGRYQLQRLCQSGEGEQSRYRES